jgi:prophage antirepressor-like protein
MNALAEFKFHSHAVRVFPSDDGMGFWVVAKDVTDALGYSRARDALRAIPENHKGARLVRSLGGEQQMLCVDEAGLYRLVLRSEKPEAEPFMEWITAEVLPSIRRTGGYVHKVLESVQPPADYVPMSPDEYADLKADYEAIQARLAVARIVVTPEEYARLTEQRLLVGKKVHLVRELVAFLESRGISREVAVELTGHDHNTIRQAAFRARQAKE